MFVYPSFDRFAVAFRRLAMAFILISIVVQQAESAEKRPIGKSATKPIPQFAQVEATVTRYFEKLPGFEAKGIITASEVGPIFPRLKKLGWDVANQKDIMKRTPSDGSFLVKELRAPAGKKFAAQIYAYPLGFDRLDRISVLPQGQDTVRRLIIGPDGYKMIQYMTTAPGGKNMGQMISNTPLGADFNKPTGRIYTLKMLVEELKKSYDASFGKKVNRRERR